MKVAVIGAGAAGVAAAWSAARAGARVVVFHAKAGATALYSGALDYDHWPEANLQHALEPRLVALITAMSCWSVGAESRVVATDGGVVRPARGADPALLDLAPLAGGVIAVARSEWLAYDAEALAVSLGASRWAADTRTRFIVVDVPLVRSEERSLNPFDLAERHDRPKRLLRLGESLRTIKQPVDAWLFGPCLGTVPGMAERLCELVGKPCGETTSPPGGPAGARFESAARELLQATGALIERVRLRRVVRVGGEWALFGDGDHTAKADAVIVAHGGLAAGGLVLESEPQRATARFRTALDVPIHAALDGKILDLASSLHGVDVQALGMSILERVGLFTHGLRVPEQERLFVAGAALANCPRTVLQAVSSGIEAGALAASLNPAPTEP